METVHIDDTLELTIESLAVGGRGVARVAGLAVFVDGGLPGQRVQALVYALRKRFAEARVVAVLSPGPHEAEPACPHFGDCGGCCWQHLAYEEQLRWKRTFVEDSFRRLAGIADVAVLPTLASPLQYGYRNKMEFTFGTGEARRLSLGLYRRSEHEIVEVADCRLQSSLAMDILAFARERCRKSKSPSYDPVTRQGFWRFLVVRESGDRCLVQIITTESTAQHAAVDDLAEKLRHSFPQIVAVVHALRRHPAQVARGESVRRVYGAGHLNYELAGLKLEVAANAFFQPNSAAAELLYATVRDLAGLAGGETVWDLYCGVGGFGLILAPLAGSVVGFEIDAAAVDNARRNARANGLSNLSFRAGDLARTLSAETSAPDLVVADPPRAGMDAAVVKHLLERRPSRIISVACDPATHARDVQRLSPAYALAAVQPVDLFPHTAHVETVALLVRRDEIQPKVICEDAEE